MAGDRPWRRLSPGTVVVYYFSVDVPDYPSSNHDWVFEKEDEMLAYAVDWFRAHIHDNFPGPDNEARRLELLTLLDRDMEDLGQELDEALDTNHCWGATALQRYTPPNLTAMKEAIADADDQG